MARKIRTKLVMELRDQGVLLQMIAPTRHVSMDSVREFAFSYKDKLHPVFEWYVFSVMRR